MGGMPSGGSLMRGESEGGDEGYGERIDDIMLHQRSDNSCHPFSVAKEAATTDKMRDIL